MRLHEETNIKHCHYYNNDKFCPYEELGCKFLNTVAEICEFGSKCTRRLCPYRHDRSRSTQNDIDNRTVDDESEMDDNSAPDLDKFVTSTRRKENFQCEECRNVYGLLCQTSKQSTFLR